MSLCNKCGSQIVWLTHLGGSRNVLHDDSKSLHHCTFYQWMTSYNMEDRKLDDAIWPGPNAISRFILFLTDEEQAELQEIRQTYDGITWRAWRKKCQQMLEADRWNVFTKEPKRIPTLNELQIVAGRGHNETKQSCMPRI